MKIKLSLILRGVLFLLLLAAFPLIASAQAYETIVNNGSSLHRVDITIVGDGYTAAQMTKYKNDVTTFIAGVFAQEPYKEYQHYFNVHRIDVISDQSGADHPERTLPVFVDTAFDATYNCQNIQRLICVDVDRVNLVTGNIFPTSFLDIVLVLVNDPEYGGSGGSVAVASTHSAAVELILHEAGHSFGLLADEYTDTPPPCVNTVEPPEPNATKEIVRALIKWNHWIAAGTPIPTMTTTNGVPGLYKGAKYCATGLYRPTFNSKMRALGRPFEQINTEQHVKRIYNLVSPIDSKTPIGNNVTMHLTQTKSFTVTTPIPLTHTLSITWTIDGIPIVNAGTTLSLLGSTLGLGTHAVQVLVRDLTPLVRNDPLELLSELRTWNVTVDSWYPPWRDDFAHVGHANISLFRSLTGTWYFYFPEQFVDSVNTRQFGMNGDMPVPGDYDADGAADIAVFRPSTGVWYILKSSDDLDLSIPFGANGDVPVPGYYDGDDVTDIAVWRPSNATWYILNSLDNTFRATTFGASGDKPVNGDYDGDNRDDLAVFRPSTGTWYLLQSTAGFTAIQFGLSTDRLKPDDYDGDRKVDIAVYRPSNGVHYVLRSSDGAIFAQQFGIKSDVPLLGDYDGDGKADIAVFRPSNGVWYLSQSRDGFRSEAFGASGDIPVPSVYVR